MEPTNPYTPPSSTLSAPPRPGLSPEGVSSTTLEHLRGTKPWVRLLSVLGFIFAILICLGGVAMMVGSSFMGEATGLTGLTAIGLGAFYLLLAFLYIFPSLWLWRYAGSIQTLLSSRRTADLDEAMKHQKAVWRFFGIISMVMIVIYALALVGIMIAAALGAAGGLGG
jgi:hypothetical protein